MCPVERALADRGELVAHAAVVVVVGDLRAGGAPLHAAGAQLAELMDILALHQSFAQRLRQLLLVVDLELLAQVDHDHVGAPRAFVIELALRIEPGR